MKRNDSMSIIVHDFAVVGPIPASNISLAKGLAAERARQVLEDPASPYLLSRICNCRQQQGGTEAQVENLGDAEEAKKLDDETEEGFAALARAALAEIEVPRVEGEGKAVVQDDVEAVVDDSDIDGEAIPDEDPMEIDPQMNEDFQQMVPT